MKESSQWSQKYRDVFTPHSAVLPKKAPKTQNQELFADLPQLPKTMEGQNP